ncbi:MAG: OmpA family protein [Bacteroidetes bacterium]|nr:OmpA family protein [Bacteroidota bacterium]
MIVACLVLAGLWAPAQNLVINGGFNDGNTCQEFSLPCGPAAWITLPVKTKVVFYGTDSKKETNKHFGLILENIKNPFNGRSYVETMLCQPLVAGQQYRLSLRCRTAPMPFERMGVLLSNDEIIDGIDTLDRLHATFDITTDSVQDKTDLKKWVTVQYSFTARGGEQFLVLGNFSRQYSPRKTDYAYDGFGNVNLSLDDIVLAPVQGHIPDIDTSCAVVERLLYAQHMRHTPFMYLLGSAKKADSTIIAKVEKADTAIIERAKIKGSPAMPADAPAEPKKIYDTLLTVPFDVNSSLLDNHYTEMLDSVLQKVLAGSFKNIIIVGHTDNTGPVALNKRLSLHRARTVATYFSLKGKIPADKIRVSGMADRRPVASNETPEGRQKNRRVEVIVHR